MSDEQQTTEAPPPEAFDTPAVPPGDAPAPEPAPTPTLEPESSPSVVERLLSEDQPAWMQAAQHVSEGGKIEVTEEQWNNLPLEAQSILHNARLELQEGKRLAAEQAGQVSEREAALQARERQLAREHTAMQTGMANALREYVQSNLKPLQEKDAPDPDSEAGLEHRVQTLTYGILNGFIDNLGKFEQSRYADYAAQEKAHQAAQATEQRRTFIQQHMADDGPLNDREVVTEFVDLRKRGYELDAALDKAVSIVAGRRGDDSDKIVQRVEARRRTMRGAGGREVIPPTPDGVEARYAFYQKYPEAEQRDLREALKLPRGL